MNSAGSELPYCVIGAGPCGLAALSNLQAAGIACEGLERENDVGGNWYYGSGSSSVYASTHLISSVGMTQFRDYEMPPEYPMYPHHTQIHEYLRNYARHFGLYDRIRFGSTVQRAEPTDFGWQVYVAGEEQPRRYAGLVVANGHHWSPRMPQLPGEFAGEVMHSHDYKTPDVLAGKRVLVIGCGNSGCDIAVEAGQVAARTCQSIRRGYHFMPKFVAGKVVDAYGVWLQSLKIPLWLRRLIARFAIRMTIGPWHRTGLPKPDHKLFEAHPIINSQLVYYIGHGRIALKPGLESIDGHTVRFTDGTAEDFDLIVCATGYDVRMPFLDEAVLPTEHGIPDLYLHAFDRTRDNLFVIGMMQPNGGLWRLAEYQAKIMAAYLRAKRAGLQAAAWFDELKQGPTPNTSGGIRFLDSHRHRLELDYYGYRQHLAKLLNKLEKRLAKGCKASADSLSQGKTADVSMTTHVAHASGPDSPRTGETAVNMPEKSA